MLLKVLKKVMASRRRRSTSLKTVELQEASNAETENLNERDMHKEAVVKEAMDTRD